MHILVSKAKNTVELGDFINGNYTFVPGAEVPVSDADAKKLMEINPRMFTVVRVEAEHVYNKMPDEEEVIDLGSAEDEKVNETDPFKIDTDSSGYTSKQEYFDGLQVLKNDFFPSLEFNDEMTRAELEEIFKDQMIILKSKPFYPYDNMNLVELKAWSRYQFNVNLEIEDWDALIEAVKELQEGMA